MDRTSPSTENDAIQLYQKTYYSLLRSSHTIRVRTLEETHCSMNSSLHSKAGASGIDIAALVYSFQRLPSCISSASVILMGQMEEVFVRAGFPDVGNWKKVKAPARRRKLYFEAEKGILAAFISSASDIDDLLPCLTAFQIEWKKLNSRLNNHDVQEDLLLFTEGKPVENAMGLLERLREALGLSTAEFVRLQNLWPGELLLTMLAQATRKSADFEVRVLASSMSDYRRAVQFWWNKIEAVSQQLNLRERPVYFVSSNAHSLANVASGLASAMKDPVFDYIKANDPEGLNKYLAQILPQGDPATINNLIYYCSKFLMNGAAAELALQHSKREVSYGIHRVSDPHSIDVEAQIIELSKLKPASIDERIEGLSEADWNALGRSDALILNIDYPLGLAAYHLFNQVSSSCSTILGFYVIGKAATLNGRVGDVMIPNVVHDEHSKNTFLFNNCFRAGDVAKALKYGDVFDNQKAVTVKGTLLQNRKYMQLFYEEGYTDIEMEAGPYLCALYESVSPKRHPLNEIVALYRNMPFDVGFLHYASDTPISQQENLLSTSLSFHGVDATYAVTSAVLSRILHKEAQRMHEKKLSSVK
jgi:hypothetical protein